MIILPAIDIINGLPVRLYQGDYGKASRVAEDVCATAVKFKEAGASWIHMVDLDGARIGHPVNRESIIKAAEETGLLVEAGGGIRTMADIEAYLEHGISRVILSTAAAEDPDLLKAALQRYGEKIAVGIDARNGKVQTAGWLADSDLDYCDFAKAMESLGIKTMIVTDISRDGTMTGPNFAFYAKLQKNVSSHIIASGGIHSYDDLVKLKEMGLYGAITGKAVYEGAVDVREAVKNLEKGERC